jgi:hypothetical protein
MPPIQVQPRHEDLACSGPAELAEAQRHLRALFEHAAVLHAAAAHDPDVARCADADRAVPDADELCALAGRLAGRYRGDPPRRVGVDEALDAFRTALVDSLDAVQACRRTAHPAGACWFSELPSIDGCSEVLRIAHLSG